MNRVDAIYDWAGLLIRDHVLSTYDVEANVLDVGAGFGKYRILLGTMPNIDACEAWEPTVVGERLRELYRHVFTREFVELTALPWWSGADYDLVVMGDVLEHMTREDAQVALERVLAIDADVLVVVPFMYPQDEEDGNVYQRHLQDDLTPELMTATYPQLKLVALETRSFRPFKGIYVGGSDA